MWWTLDNPDYDFRKAYAKQESIESKQKLIESKALEEAIRRIGQNKRGFGMRTSREKNGWCVNIEVYGPITPSESGPGTSSQESEYRMDLADDGTVTAFERVW